MKKVVYTLDIDNYSPDITALTFPLMRFYARKIGADFQVIRRRAFPEFPIPYEKLQLHQLSIGNDWTIFFDADTLVHPELLDITQLLPRDTCANNGSDPSFIRHTQDKYFLRDGRNIGTCGWCIVASDWTRDIWQPLDEANDMAREQALACCWPTMVEASSLKQKVGADGKPLWHEDGVPVLEKKIVIDKAHLLDDFVMSRNIAKYGLKYTTLPEIWKKVNQEGSAFFWHQYTISVDEKATRMRKVLENEWRVPDELLADFAVSVSVTVPVQGVSSKTEAKFAVQ